MPTQVPKLLDQAAGVLCRALESLLPGIDRDWWTRCVVGKLSFQQQQHVERRGITNLDQLDLAALLRIVDQNWYELADGHKWPYDGRNFVKEMQTVRNRWAHAQVAEPPREDIYRDLDTLHRFLTFLCPQEVVDPGPDPFAAEIVHRWLRDEVEKDLRERLSRANHGHLAAWACRLAPRMEETLPCSPASTLPRHHRWIISILTPHKLHSLERQLARLAFSWQFRPVTGTNPSGT